MNLKTEVKNTYPDAYAVNTGGRIKIYYTVGGYVAVDIPAEQTEYMAWLHAYNAIQARAGGTLATFGMNEGDRLGDNETVREQAHETIEINFNYPSQAAYASVASQGTIASTASYGTIASQASQASTASRPALGQNASQGSQASIASHASLASQGTNGGTSVASRASVAEQPALPAVKGQAHRPTSTLSTEIPADLTPNSITLEADNGSITIEGDSTPNSKTLNISGDRSTLSIGDIPGTNYTGTSTALNFQRNGVSKLSMPRLESGWHTLIADPITATSHINLNSNGTPSVQKLGAQVFGKDVSSLREVFVMDEGGTETQISPHSRQAPNDLYDDEDGIPDLVVEEIQHYAGKVRYTNKTRQARLSSMTDAEKTALSDTKRRCIYVESFAQHNNRCDCNLVQLDWDTEQNRLQARYDAETESLKHHLLSLADQPIDNAPEIALIEMEIAERDGKDIRKPKPDWLK
jgi:hypothetical protein